MYFSAFRCTRPRLLESLLFGPVCRVYARFLQHRPPLCRPRLMKEHYGCWVSSVRIEFTHEGGSASSRRQRAHCWSFCSGSTWDKASFIVEDTHSYSVWVCVCLCVCVHIWEGACAMAFHITSLQLPCNWNSELLSWQEIAFHVLVTMATKGCDDCQSGSLQSIKCNQGSLNLNISLCSTDFPRGVTH